MANDDMNMQIVIEAQNNTSDGFESMNSAIQTFSDGINSLTKVFEELAKTITETMSSATQAFEETAKSVEDMSQPLQTATEEMNSIGTASDEVARQISEVSSGLDNIGEAASRAGEEAASDFEKISSASSKTGEAVNAVSKNIDNVGESAANSANEVEKDMERMQTSALHAEEGFGSVSRQMDDLFAGMALSAIGVPLDEALKKSAESFGTFDQSMRLVNEEAKLNDSGFKNLESSVLSLSNQTGISANELSKGLYNVMSTGLTDAAGGMTVLQVAANASKAGMASLDDTTKALDSVLGAYGMTADQATNVMDEMFLATNDGQMHFQDLAKSVGASATSAAMAGVSYSELAASEASLTNVGKDAQLASQQLNSLIMGIIAPTAGATKEAKALGIEWGASALKAHGLSYMINEATRATGGNDEKLKKLIPNQRAWQAVVALGTTAHGLYTKTLNDMSDATGSTAKALEEYDKGAGDSIEKMKTSINNAFIALGEAMAPAVNSVTSAITSMTEAFQNLSPATREFIGDAMAVVGGLATLGSMVFLGRSGLRALAAAFGIGKEASAAATAIETVAITAGEAGTAMEGVAVVGTTALEGGLVAVAAAAAPFLIAGAAVAATGYAIYKGLQQQATPAVDLFANKVTTTSDKVAASHGRMSTQITTDVVKISDATKQAVGAYIDMDNNVTKSLDDIYVHGTTITAQTVKSLVDQYDQMGTQIKAGMDKHYNDEYSTMQQFFAKGSSLTQTEQANALASLQKNNADKKKEVDSYEKQIQDILQKASDEHRNLTLDEQQKINAIQDKMKTNAINSLSENETQAKVIMQRIKDYGANITAQQASEIIQNANKQRDGSIQAANDTYDKTVAEIIQMRDQSHSITSDQADKLIADAKRQKDDTITHAKDLRDGVVNKVTDMNKNVSDSVDKTDGHILTEWDKLKAWWDNWTPVTKIFSFLISGTQQASNPDNHINQKGGYATGTDNATKGWHMVGENGPELINFGGGETVLNNSNTTALLNSSPIMGSGSGNSPTIYITVNASGNIARNERELGQIVAKEIWNQTKMQGKFPSY